MAKEHTETDSSTEEIVSQDQQETQASVEPQAVPEEQSVDVQEETPAVPAKKRGKKARPLTEADMVKPQQSIWPFALAVAIAFVLVGIITHPVITGIGAVLVAVCIFGWALERRR